MSRYVRSFFFSGALFVGVLATTGLALAQTESGEKPKPRRTPLSEVNLEELLLEEITVTARKKEERLQTAPLSMTALLADDLRNLNIDELSGVGGFTPNLLFEGTSGDSDSARVYIRGIGQDDPISTSDPGVAVYVDGVYLGRTVGSNLSLNDIERVEVLRGPQGTVFGKNTIGGAINVVTKQPVPEFSSEVQTRIGNHGRLDTGLSLNVPLLEETLSSRFSFQSRYSRGQYVNEFDGADWDNDRRFAFAGKLRFEPSSSWTATLALDRLYAREHIHGVEALELAACSTDVGALALALCNGVVALYSSSPAFGLDDDIRRGSYNAGRPGLTIPAVGVPDVAWGKFGRSANMSDDNIDVFGSALTVDYDLSPDMRFKSITAWRLLETRRGEDDDGLPIEILSSFSHFAHHQFSQELQFQGGTADGRMDWVGGLYMFRESSATDTEVVALPHLILAAGLDTSFASKLNAETLSYAGFANTDYELIPTLKLSAGLRYTYERKSFDRFATSLFQNNPFTGGPLPPSTPTSSQNEGRWGGWSFRVGLTKELASDSILYTSFSRGIRSGGFNGRSGESPTQLIPYAQETAKTLEVGAKGRFLGGRLLLRGAAFYNQNSEMQLTVPTINPASGFFMVLVENAGKARIVGLEAEFEMIPAPGWLLRGGVGVTDAEYLEFETDDNNSCPPFPCAKRDVSDRKLKNSPALTFNVRAERTIPMGRERGALIVRGDYSYRSRVYHELQNYEASRQNGFGLVGARVAWRNPDDTLEVALWGRNLLDREYLSHAVSYKDTGGVALGFYGDGRAFGLEASYRFE